MERVIVLSVVTHETDTVECFVRHHAPACDRIVLVARHPDTAMLGILNGLKAEGLPVTIARDGGSEGTNADILSREMQNLARSQSAEWILPLDPDEFLVLPPERSLADILRQLPRDRVAFLPRRMYIPTPEDNVYAPTILRRIIHRRASEDGKSGALLIPAGCVKEGMTLDEESRMLRSGVAQVEMLRSAVLTVAHFPIRSSEQLTTKVLHSVIADTASGGASGRTWKPLFDRSARGQPWSTAELRNIALRFGMAENNGVVPGLVRDPVPTTVTVLRYGQSHVHPLETLSRAAMTLAAHSALRRSRKTPKPEKDGALSTITARLEEAIESIAPELDPLLQAVADPEMRASSLEAAVVLVLGMFSAHIRSPAGEQTALGARMELAARMPALPPRWTLLQEILMRPKLPSTLEVALRELTTTLMATDLAACMRECRTAQGNEDCFSAVLCALSGKFAPSPALHVTPGIAVLASQAADALLKDAWKIGDGLAGREVMIVDPMAGTGDMLREVVRRCTIAAMRRGTNAGALHEELRARFRAHAASGLHASLQHLHCSVLLEHYDMRFPAGSDLPTFVGAFPAMGQDASGVAVLCTKLPFEGSTGRYAGMSPRQSEILKEYARQQAKYGADAGLEASDLLQSLAGVQAMLEESERSMGILVAPRHLLHASAFRDARRHLTESFEQVWVLDLHGEESVRGGGDEPLPGSDASGLCMIVLVRGRGIAQHIRYCSLKGLKLEKMHALYARPFMELSWQRIGPEHPMYLLIPR